jgi:hypothetical protein
MSEFELPKGSGWEAVDRWLKESEATAPIPQLLPNALARWGTRGFVAGLCGGVFALIVGQRITGDSALDGKALLAYPMAAALVAVPGALVGMPVGFLTWFCQRWARAARRGQIVP